MQSLSHFALWPWRGGEESQFIFKLVSSSISREGMGSVLEPELRDFLVLQELLFVLLLVLVHGLVELLLLWGGSVHRSLRTHSVDNLLHRPLLLVDLLHEGLTLVHLTRLVRLVLVVVLVEEKLVAEFRLLRHLPKPRRSTNEEK